MEREKNLAPGISGGITIVFPIRASSTSMFPVFFWLLDDDRLTCAASSAHVRMLHVLLVLGVLDIRLLHGLLHVLLGVRKRCTSASGIIHWSSQSTRI